MKLIGATIAIVLFAGAANATPYAPFPSGNDGRWGMKHERQVVAKRHGRSIRHRSYHRKHLRGFTKIARSPGRASVSLDGIISPLAEKVKEIITACGSSVISAYRPGARVRGSDRPSLHASYRAVDIKGNPSCIYANLAGWSGGYSTDYRVVNHVHISLGGREMGARFAHYQPNRRTRYAYHRRIRYSRI